MLWTAVWCRRLAAAAAAAAADDAAEEDERQEHNHHNDGNCNSAQSLARHCHAQLAAIVTRLHLHNSARRNLSNPSYSPCTWHIMIIEM